MRCLSDIYNKISGNNIELFSYEMVDKDAVTIRYRDIYGIFVDYRKLNNSEAEFMALSHEYGHCKSGTTHKLHSSYQLIEQHENRANRAAVHELLPYESLIDAVNKGNTELWQIAEYLDIPEAFAKMAIDVYEKECYYNNM